ncbi:hypothetical protein L1987_48291 [Smallanthus sonchifolius]|uniref:Uncharacterized protein n=1 Tax=Smallanthus sonchifolius TaxID=185202 RepID=A0ACB9FR88_9ASTR|nr:hypothetical protein L1987_48291 [Smallanthus sonchifolius]
MEISCLPTGLKRVGHSHDLRLDLTLFIWFSNISFDFCTAPRFSDLAPSRSDTDKRIEALLEIPAVERHFHLESAISEASFNIQYSKPSMSSGARRSSSRFTLDDIDSMVSKSKRIKKEQPIAESSKPEIPTPCPKITIGKKRKLCEAADVAIFEGMDYTNAYKKLRVLNHSGLE